MQNLMMLTGANRLGIVWSEAPTAEANSRALANGERAIA